jgi:hypothetical protein
MQSDGSSKEACTVGELRALLGNVEAESDILNLRDDECLCWIDMEATAAKARRTIETDGIEWTFGPNRIGETT